MSPSVVAEQTAPVTMESRIAATLASVKPEESVLQQTIPATEQTLAAPDASPSADAVVEATEDDYVFDVTKDPLSDPIPAATQTSPSEQPTVRDQEIAEIKQAFAGRGGISDTKAQKVYADFVALREVENDLGYKPDAQQILQATKSAQDLDLMRTDFQTVAPGAAAGFSQYWFDPTMPGAVEMASQLPMALSEINPKAFEALATPIAAFQIQKIDEFAADERRTPEERAELKYAADLLRHITKAGGVNGASKSAPQNDEVAQLRAEIARMRGSQQNQVVTGIKQQISTHENQVIERDVDQALAILDKSFPNSPTLKTMARERLINVVRTAISNNPNVVNVTSAQKQRMIASGQTNELDSMTRMIRQAYSNALVTERTNFLKEAGLQLKAQSEKAVAVLQQGSQKTAVPVNGITPNRAAETISKHPNESQQSFLERKLRATMMAGRPS